MKRDERGLGNDIELHCDAAREVSCLPIACVVTPLAHGFRHRVHG